MNGRDCLRVALLMSDTGGGHRSCSQAIADGLVRLLGDTVEPRLIDFFALGQPGPYDRISQLYGPVIRIWPGLYGALFHLTDRPAVFQRLARNAARSLLPKLRAALTEMQPDVIVSVHALANWLVLRAREVSELDVPVAAMVTELVSVHYSWVDPRIDAYFTATDEVHRATLARGADAGRTSLVGLPVGGRFGRVEQTTAELRRQFGLAPDRFTVLIMGGGEGAGGIRQLVRALDETDFPGQLLVVCGRNEALRRSLESTPPRLPAAIFGFVRTIPELMQAADVVVTKAGPQSIAEALTSARPVILTEIIPGQEEGNDRFVESHGVGFHGRSPRRIAGILSRLAASPAEVRSLQANALSLRRPDAADQVARAIAELAEAGVRHT